MSLYLYPKNETEFDTNGLGSLADAVDDEVYEVLNGQFELTVQYPVTGRRFADIVTDAYITARPNPFSMPQPFRIYRITKPMRGIVTIYARHRTYNLKKVVVAPFAANNIQAAFQGLKDNAVTACPFEFWTAKDTAASMTVAVPTDVWSLLGGSRGSILDTYGGEYEFDGKCVKLWARRGVDRGVSIRYGKNLTSLEQDENIANVYTGVYPYWTDGEGNMVQLPERYISGPGNYAEEKILPLDLSQSFETQPSEDELRARTQKYIEDNDIGKPDVSLTVEFVQLDQKGREDWERVMLGDTVSVYFPKLGVDVSARAVAARYKPTLGRYKNITLGKIKSNLASTIAAQGKAIQDTLRMVQAPSIPASSDDNATNWITNGKGYMVAVRDEEGNWMELCSLDTPDISAAQNVWRWNNGGFGFSSDGYGGPYETAITQDGRIVAKFVTTGCLASADGSVFFDLDKALLRTERVTSGEIDGVTISGGVIQGTHQASGEDAYTLKFQIYNNANGVFFIGMNGSPIHIISDGGIKLGQEDAPLYVNGKRAGWVDSGQGFSYLIAPDTE